MIFSNKSSVDRLLSNSTVVWVRILRKKTFTHPLFSILDYRGVLACLDGYMNIALEQTEEYSGGQLKNKYGDAFIRGNNVLYISTQRKK